ncbi:MAG TPA: hypothetical protein VFB84_22365, partial [Micromonosporaceae bacterium]|nr:hypothetical protein [Micromonosporaceae bacterium]
MAVSSAHWRAGVPLNERTYTMKSWSEVSPRSRPRAASTSARRLPSALTWSVTWESSRSGRPASAGVTAADGAVTSARAATAATRPVFASTRKAYCTACVPARDRG